MREETSRLSRRSKKRAVFPAFITSAVLKGFVVPLSSGTDASKTAASLQAQSSPTAIRHTVPAIDRGNAELPVHIAFQFDLNRIPGGPTMRTPISGCPSWARANAPSVQILRQRPRRKKCLADKPGAPGRDLGTLDRCGPDAIRTLLQTPPRSSAGWQGDCPSQIPSAMTTPGAYGERGDRKWRTSKDSFFFTSHGGDGADE